MNPESVVVWSTNWAWSMPLIVLTVVIHVLGLGLVNEWVRSVLSPALKRRHLMFVFVTVMGVTVTLVTLLHGIEATAWAAAYQLLGALPDSKSAMLYSLSAMTSYGHATLFLEGTWQLMGALEALNGMLLFGLTTAFLFAIIHQIWLNREQGRLYDQGSRDHLVSSRNVSAGARSAPPGANNPSE
jgi:MFS superfamily sulfate permease-like transporter